MIFINSAPGAMHYVRMGYYNALQYLGYDVLYTNIDDNYINMLEAFAPTHIIGSTWDFDYKHIETLKKISPRLILRASEWSEYAFKIGSPLCLVNDKEKEIIKDLVNFGLIKFVNTYYNNKYTNILIGGWKEICDIKSSLLAADTIQFKPLNLNKELDFSFVGGYWPYKSKYLDWIVNLSYKYINKICGSGWPWPITSSFIPDNMVNHLFNISKICPNVMEPISIDYHFDVNERTYKTLASGTFSIIQKTESSVDIFEDSVDYFETQEELFDKFDYYINNIQSTKQYLNKSIKIIEKHNYINRVQEFINEY